MNVKITEVTKPKSSPFPLEDGVLYKYTFPSGAVIIGLVKQDRKGALKFIPIHATEDEPHNFVIWDHDFNYSFPSATVLSANPIEDFGVFTKYEGKIELSNE